jgi:Protein of unknown function DUF262/Protein of unknown function (DUF1524)
MLDARAKTVQEILHATDQYLIPFFQRSYSWEDKHWRRLLADVDALAESSPDRRHFLGPLVCTPVPHVPGEVTPYQLIDGQQRVTTITLMLCALRDLASEYGQTDLAEEIKEDFLLHKRRQGLDRFKVVPRLGDREALLAILESKDIGPWRGFQVAKCLRFFLSRFRKRAETEPAQTLRRLLRDVTSRMGLVVITVVGENPYKIFESLNSTGLPLAQADLVRNYVFMNVPLEDQQAFYEEYWRPFEAMFNGVGTEPAIDATAFYRDYLLRDGTYLPARDTYADFRDQHLRRGLSAQAQVAELRRFLRFELWLRRPSNCEIPSVRSCLLELSRLDVSTSHPLILSLLSLLEDQSISLETFEMAMRDLSSFVMRRSLTGESTRAYGRWFTEAVKRIGKDVVEDLRGVWVGRGWPNDAELSRQLLEFPIYRREPEKCRLILERLEQSYGHKEKVDPSTLTIEHILPQTIDDGPAGIAWKGVLGPEWFQVHQQWVHTLGNLTLTGYNAEMSNRSYEIKRKALIESNLVLNSYFERVESWGIEAIRRRGLELAAQVASLWPNPRQRETPIRDGPAAKATFDVEQLRVQSLARLARICGVELIQTGDARYVSPDGRVHLLCLASQPYDDRQGQGYWFGVSPMQLDFLRDGAISHVALCCGSPDRILWIPRDDFLALVENMNKTADKHWHIQIAGGDTIRLDQPKKRTKADVTRYLLPPP